MTTATPKPHEHIVFTEFEGGEGVLVDLNTKRYYQLNETAMLIWRCLEKGMSRAQIIEEMVSIYDVTPERAAESLGRVLQNFANQKLVSQSS
jgi:hypothetical protein